MEKKLWEKTITELTVKDAMVLGAIGVWGSVAVNILSAITRPKLRRAIVRMIKKEEEIAELKRMYKQ